MQTSTLPLALALTLVFATQLGCPTEDDSPIELDNGQALLTVTRSPFCWRVASVDGIVHEQPPALTFTLDDGSTLQTTEVVLYDVGDDQLSVRVATEPEGEAELVFSWTEPRRLQVEISLLDVADLATIRAGHSLVAGERIYGLTERLRDSEVMVEATNGPMVEDMFPVEEGSLDRRGEVVEMFVHPTLSLYNPFHHSSTGFGVWVEDTTPGVYDVGVTDLQRLDFTFETGSTEASRTLTYHVLLGPGHDTIVRHYYALTGDPVRPPDWAFLHWRWRGELPTGEFAELDGELVNADIAEDILAYEQHGIPFGVYLFDRPVLGGGGDPYNGGFAIWEWDEERIVNPQHTLDALRDRGMPLAIWWASWAQGDEPGTVGAEAAALGYHAADNGLVMDWTNPDAVAWWIDRTAGFLSEWGLQGLKLDRGAEQIPDEVDDLWHDGRHGRELHNEFQTLQARVHHDALDQATGGDFVLMPRAGYSGAQQYAVYWGGDTPGTSDLGLRMAIIELQRAGFMGFPTWGSDTGGYYEFDDREVFARWLQFSAFTPIMEIGGEGTHAPWDMPTDPAYDEELIEIYRRYVQLHHDLQPYFAAQANAAASSGMPISRAMVFDYPDDPALVDRWDQFLCGPHILVAPVWRSGERSREVVLPEGAWEWLWDRSVTYTGPTTVTVDAPLDTIPVFVRPGFDVALTDQD